MHPQRCKHESNVILDNRPPDFEEGVILYDRFLRSAEKHFAEEDFLIDTHAQIQQLQAENTRLTSENIQLKYTITTMEKQQNNQYNNCVIYNAPVYNTSTTNNYYSKVEDRAEDITPAEDLSSSVTSESDSDIPDSIIFTKKAKNEGKIDTIIQSLQKSVQGRKDKTRAFVQELQEWQKEGYVDAHYNARVMYDELDKLTPLSFGYEVFKKYYNNTI